MTPMKRRILLVVAMLVMALALSAKTYQVTANKLNVRNAPETGAVIGSLTLGTEVEVVSINKGWAEITYKGKKAYVSAQFLSPVKKTNTNKNTANDKAKQAANDKDKAKQAAKNDKNNKNNKNNKNDKNANKANAKNDKSGKNDKKDTKKDIKTAGNEINNVTDPIIAGFHMSWDMLWEGRNVYRREVDENGKKSGWSKAKMGANGDEIFGFSIGLGMEYNGIVHRTPKANIMVGFRTGVYYDWYGSLKHSIPLYGDRSVPARWSIHSFTIPLQPTVSFEWRTKSGLPMGFGFYTGPIFEPYFAFDVIQLDKSGFTFVNYITGHAITLSGEGIGSGVEYPDRCGVFSCLWGTGVWLQISKIRFLVSTDWEIDNYPLAHGGKLSSGKIEPHVDGHLNRFITLGFSYVFH